MVLVIMAMTKTFIYLSIYLFIYLSIYLFVFVTHHDSLLKVILQGILESGRRRGRQRKCWLDNIKEWTSLPIPELLTRASCRRWLMV